MTIRDLLEALDGQGLVLTDEGLIKEGLTELGLDWGRPVGRSAGLPRLLAAAKGIRDELDALEKRRLPCIPSLGVCDDLDTAIRACEKGGD